MQQRAIEAAPVDAAEETTSPAPLRVKATRRRTVRWLPDILAVLGLVACVVAFFWPLLQGRMYSVVPSAQRGILPWAVEISDYPRAVQDDQAILSYPWQVFTTNTVRQGTLPLWDPHDFGGYPFLTNGSAGVLNPLRLALALTLVPAQAHGLFSAFQLIAGGLFAYLLARDLGLRRWGSLLASVAWMLSGWNIGWLHLEVVSPVIALFPLGLLTVGRAVRRRRLGWTVLAAASLAWVMVSVHLLFALITLVICLLYGFALAIAPLLRRGSDREPRLFVARMLRLAGLGAGSAALAAPMLLPTFLALQDSQRNRMTYAVLKQQWVAAPSWFLTTFAPAKLPLTEQTLNGRMAFAGTATAILALVGLTCWRRPAARLGGLMAAGLFLVAIGTPLTWLAFHFVPGLNVFRPYSRLMMWWPLAIGLLAGAGLDRLVDWMRGSAGGRRVPRWRPGVAGGVAFALVAVTAVQLLVFGRDITPPFPQRSSKLLFPDTQLLASMRASGTSVDRWPSRSIGVSVSQAMSWSHPVLLGNVAMITGVDSMAGYDSTLPSRSTDVIRVLAGENPGVVLAGGLDAAYAPTFDTNARLDLLARLGVSQLALAPSLRLDDAWAAPLRRMGAVQKYQGKEGVLIDLPPSGPRLVGGTEAVNGRVDSFHAFLSNTFDNTSTVVLEHDQMVRMGAKPLPAQAGSGGRVVEATRGTNSGRLVVEADRPSWLLIPEGWDAGWAARVNGSSTPVLRANYYQRAVLVPAGHSVVTLRYRPKGWSAGLAICFVSVGLCATAAGALWLRRRRSDRSLPAEA